MVFRRSAPTAAQERFADVAIALDRAQRALLLAIPTARHPGAPLTEALDAFEVGLEEVDRLMPSWRSEQTEALWQTSTRALAKAREEAARLRASPPGPTEFERLNARVGDVLDPLEDFTEAERALRKAR